MEIKQNTTKEQHHVTLKLLRKASLKRVPFKLLCKFTMKLKIKIFNFPNQNKRNKIKAAFSFNFRIFLLFYLI